VGASFQIGMSKAFAPLVEPMVLGETNVMLVVQRMRQKNCYNLFQK
jgi:hypothetical protein